eukprot:TRINITY_DN14613_c0_g1_i1.p1 TRINITY_DN14613_c0_g1~~TRINITY_DN14613_c0_g1_i1.p1  ORF type:complete len:102 (-),score=2.04 TRINITY_DN14613_c0_g1_i1:119-424(-)
MTMLITRGCSEMSKLAAALGAQPHTLAGLSGIGDLMLTCFGALSRNKSVGIRLGQGESLQSIMDSMGAQERVCHRGWHRGGAGPGYQHHDHAHHPRVQRDE